MSITVFIPGAAGGAASTVAISQSGTDNDVDANLRVGGSSVANGNPVPISDAAGSITVDQGTATNLKVDASGVAVPITDNSGSITVDQGTATNLKVDASGVAVPITDNSSSLTVDAPVGTPAFARLSDGTAALTTTGGRLSVDASGVAVPITDNSSSLTVDQGTAANLNATVVQGTATNLKVDASGVAVPITDNSGSLTVDQATAASLNAAVVGNSADAASDSGNPIKVAGIGRTTNRTAVTDGQRVNLTADDLGRQVTAAHQVRDLISHQHTQIASSSSETTIVSAIASTFTDIISLVITNQTATAVNCTLKDSTAGTTRAIFALAASGGMVFTPSAPLPQLAAVNNNWTITLSSAAVTVNILAQFAKNV